MSIQILDIVLYSHDGRNRVLTLRTGQVNVITGASKTGKSSLIDIVDYILGASECHVPKGPIRNAVAWFGIRLQLASGQAFVARKCPDPKALSSEDCFVEVGNLVTIPPASGLRQTTNTKGVGALAAGWCGISENIFEPPPGQTRQPLSATVRHALAFCFQPQDEIIRRNQLFHGANDNYVAQSIKDTLPFFLGAVDNEYVRKRDELRRVKDEIRDNERRLNELAALRGDGAGKAAELLAQARDVGLSRAIPNSWDGIIAALRDVAAIPLAKEEDVGTDTPARSEFARLSNEREKLLDDQRRIRDEIDAVRSFEEDERAYSHEANEQRARLATIGIFDGGEAKDACPLCAQKLPVSTSTVLPSDIKSEMRSLSTKLDSLTRAEPKIEKAIADLTSRLQVVQQALAKNRSEMEAVRKASDQLSKVRDEATRRSHILGRISLYLESMPDLPDTKALELKLEALRARYAHLENELSEDRVRERLESIASILGQRMTEWARRLDLEHSKFPLRLDAKKLTVVADTLDGPVPMSGMGSGENWVGYHLIAHLALHQWFVKQSRPVPRFLFLDQPSQVYFPPERIQKGLNLADNDREAVSRMFQLIFDAVGEVAPGLQVVMTEHADIDESWYQQGVIERWRQGLKLVPEDWPYVGTTTS